MILGVVVFAMLLVQCCGFELVFSFVHSDCSALLAENVEFVDHPPVLHYVAGVEVYRVELLTILIPADNL